jgi:hypothetical protein
VGHYRGSSVGDVGSYRVLVVVVDHITEVVTVLVDIKEVIAEVVEEIKEFVAVVV